MEDGDSKLGQELFIVALITSEFDIVLRCRLKVTINMPARECVVFIIFTPY